MKPRLGCSVSLLNSRGNDWFFKCRPPGGLLEGYQLSLEPRLQREAVAGPTRVLITDREVNGESSDICLCHLSTHLGLLDTCSSSSMVIKAHNFSLLWGPPTWGRRQTYSRGLIMFGSLPHSYCNSQGSRGPMPDVRGWSLFQ